MTETKIVPAYSIRILIAGDISVIKQVCREYCYHIGFCVTVTPTTYIYTGGEEEGVIIELINYARFPAMVDEIKKHAHNLAVQVMCKACQHGFTLQDHETSTWHTRRET